MFNSFKSQPSSIPAIITHTTQISGDITCETELQLDGSVQGNLNVNKLTIGSTGLVTGNIHSSDLTIHGKVEGDIHAKQVILRPSAQVFGNIEHETLTIEAGAHVEGKLTHHSERANNVTLIDSSATQTTNN
ncbi:polymer-forming cytoskeletal protein [Pseudoalteromonas sp. J010]|uniref:bactofilin family protein n=1 Tax=Pseudoalteromonas sp. J010 TaxID=998465 RepID=UPI000F654D1A|nr:polymer-forming cytoskeletal protein [Pseudoalteromonas sp. J010]RRS09453.1 polymer-forming cytoskeletal protein [Pseudoalteromonas sp. J010]